MQSFRFKSLCDRFKYKIKPVMCIINGKHTRRPDILAVEKHNKWVMTIPKKMFANKIQGYTDIIGLTHPNYYDCEQVLYYKKFKA
jgi:hypothetical protein